MPSAFLPLRQLTHRTTMDVQSYHPHFTEEETEAGVGVEWMVGNVITLPLTLEI